ncbi:MAG: rRNA maturation RNase YbeY [Pseudomonadota bacterium]
METDGSSTVALTVANTAWRDAFDALEASGALEAFDALQALEALVDRIVRAALDEAAATPWLRTGEVSLLLTDDAEIRTLNATYRERDKATNVLSFPGLDLVDGKASKPPLPGPVTLGDVAISFERMAEEAKAERKGQTDHFAHLLVHGTLHLLGYDHTDDGRARVMEDLEAVILKSLGFSAPYAAFADADHPGMAT